MQPNRDIASVEALEHRLLLAHVDLPQSPGHADVQPVRLPHEYLPVSSHQEDRVAAAAAHNPHFSGKLRPLMGFDTVVLDADDPLFR